MITSVQPLSQNVSLTSLFKEIKTLLQNNQNKFTTTDELAVLHLVLHSIQTLDVSHCSDFQCNIATTFVRNELMSLKNATFKPEKIVGLLNSFAQLLNAMQLTKNIILFIEWRGRTKKIQYETKFKSTLEKSEVIKLVELNFNVSSIKSQELFVHVKDHAFGHFYELEPHFAVGLENGMLIKIVESIAHVPTSLAPKRIPGNKLNVQETFRKSMKTPIYAEEQIQQLRKQLKHLKLDIPQQLTSLKEHLSSTLNQFKKIQWKRMHQQVSQDKLNSKMDDFISRKNTFHEFVSQLSGDIHKHNCKISMLQKKELQKKSDSLKKEYEALIEEFTISKTDWKLQWELELKLIMSEQENFKERMNTLYGAEDDIEALIEASEDCVKQSSERIRVPELDVLDVSELNRYTRERLFNELQSSVSSKSALATFEASDKFRRLRQFGQKNI